MLLFHDQNSMRIKPIYCTKCIYPHIAKLVNLVSYDNFHKNELFSDCINVLKEMANDA